MFTVININLLLAACEYTSVFTERKTNPKSETTHCLTSSYYAGHIADYRLPMLSYIKFATAKQTLKFIYNLYSNYYFTHKTAHDRYTNNSLTTGTVIKCDAIF